MTGRPVGALRVVAHLTRVSARRWVNRYLARLRKKKKGRTGTARSSGRSIPILIIFGGLLLFQSMSLSSMLVGRLSNGIAEYHGRDDDEHPYFGLGPSTEAWPAAQASSGVTVLGTCPATVRPASAAAASSAK